MEIIVKRHNGNKLVFSKSNLKNKKYRVEIFYKNGNKETKHFGHSKYQHFQDKIGLYSHLNHYDKTRRKNYKARHTVQAFHKQLYSPAWFSLKYLW